MFRTAIVAFAIAASSMTANAGAAAQPRSFALPGQWAVMQVGDQRVGQCLLGIRSDATNPQAGQPQFMIIADDQFAILRVRAAEWSFAAAGDVPVTLVTAGGHQRTPSAVVRGPDMIDIAFDFDPNRIDEFTGADHLDVGVGGGTVRLPLKGFKEMLPAYRDCLASIGQPAGRVLQAAAALPR